MNELGEYIKEHRKNQKLTTTELAYRTGLSQSYISHIENGRKKKPTIDALIAISKGLEVPDIILLEKAGYIKTFGKSIKSLREKKGLSIKDLELKSHNFEYGKPIYLNEKRIISFENGEVKNPSVFELYLIANALEVSPWEISTVDLDTPQKDINEFIESESKPDPFLLLDQVITMLRKKLTHDITDTNEKLLTINRINNHIKQKIFYSKQLNQLSANGEDIIKNEDLVEIFDIETADSFIPHQIDDYHISFRTPTKTVSVGDKKLRLPMQASECEMEFYDLNNLIYISNKININNKILNEKQKKAILNIIRELID